MGTKNPRVDAFIAKSAPFAKPILTHVRGLVHEVCPDITETVKWGMPFFETAGGPVCHLAAFKAHCAFGFWKGKLMKDAALFTGPGATGAMGNLGKIQSLSDLPSDKVITAWLKEAVSLNEAGVKAPRARKFEEASAVAVPADLTKRLRANKAAREHFDAFSPGKRRDYIVWITEAKSDETRAKRLDTALEQIAEGKSRNWKYETKPAARSGVKKSAVKKGVVSAVKKSTVKKSAARKSA